MAQLDRFKITALTWDSDKDPSGFFLWMENMSALVRATEHGAPLEIMLDEKLRRATVTPASVPGFILDDPDFAITYQPQPTAPMANSSVSEKSVGPLPPPMPSPHSASLAASLHSSFSLGAASTAYADLPDQTRALDALLYNVLKINIKGARNSLIACVTFPSYVQAMCVLSKHMDISKTDRIMRALDAWDKLQYKGNVAAYQTEVMALKRELDASGANITHFIMGKVMRSFDGKSKSIQFKIAEDMNTHPIDESLNVYDLVQTYCADLASVGDGNTAKVGNVNVTCHGCGKAGHKRPDCPDKNKSTGKGGKAQGSDKKGGKGEKGKFKSAKKDIVCHHCGKQGHIRPECPDKDKPAASASAPAAAPTAAPAPAPSVNNVGLSQQSLQQLVEVLRSGSNGVNMVKVVSNVKSKPNPTNTDETIIISGCDGMGSLALSLKAVNANCTRYISIENNATKRVVCDNANPSDASFPGADHSWQSDIYNVTEEKIAALGYNAVKFFGSGPPCEDGSKLRLLPGYRKIKGSNPRPGFDGKKGKVFVQVLQVLAWILKYNPDCEYLIENVDFSDLPDYQLVCDILGEPLRIDSADHSYTRRVRLWWTNIPVPDDYAELTEGFSPLRDYDSCMDPGRTVHPYEVAGKTTVRTIGKSWRGDPHNPIADTSVPVLVTDEQFEKPQHLRPSEAEKLMGMPSGTTAGSGVTAKDRLFAIGDAWDLNVSTMIVRFSKLANTSLNVASCTVDSTALTRTALQHMPQLDSLTDEDRVLQCGLVHVRDTEGSDAVAAVLSKYDLKDQMHMLALLAAHDRVLSLAATCDYQGSVLDSGSSRHLSPDTHVTNTDDCLALTGFNNSEEWTQGNGYLPLQFYDAQSNVNVSVDIPNSDKLDNLASPVLSLGKLLRDGYSFTFDDPEHLYAYAPGGAHKFLVELGRDDILRLPHEIRTGSSSRPLPPTTKPVVPVPVMAVTTRALQRANGIAFHDIFGHCNMEKVYQTLLHTRGYKAIRFPEFVCNSCAKAKAVRKGLSHAKHPQSAAVELVLSLLVGDQDSSEYDDDNHDDADDPSVSSVDLHYVSPVAGRALGTQPVPRFDLDQLRPFEVMFCDNKDYDAPVRGGRQVSFLLYDYKSTAKFKVDLFSKKDNGEAFRRIVALNGIHKLPYSCRVWTDGCGSMVHVELTAALMGLDHSYIPPHEQSLNEAEKICNTIWATAEAQLLHAKAPDTLLAESVGYALYVDMRTATTPGRDYMTPYEIIKGVQPSIDKLHRFYTQAYVVAPKQKRKALIKQGIRVRAEEGRFLGFQSPYSTTYRVLLTGNRLVHSINVTFDDSNFTADASTPAPAGGSVTLPLPLAAPGVQSEEASQEPTPTVSPQMELTDGFQVPNVHIEHCDLFDQAAAPSPESFDLDDPEMQAWQTHAGSPQPRPRPSYTFLCEVEASVFLAQPAADESITAALRDFCMSTSGSIDQGVITYATRYLAMVAQKDISWKKALAGAECDKAIAALLAEKASLLDTILVPIPEDHPDYAQAVAEAITGRYLLDIKRSGIWKARGVKQGFKEDKTTADGPGFQYYSHVAKFVTIRMSLFRPNRGTRRLAIKDVCTAFLQSDRFPDNTIKFVVFYDPLLCKWEYFRQLGPLYGECSAPVRWENTYSPFLEDEGFIRGNNEPSVFYQPKLDLLNLWFVDDSLLDAEEDSVQWGSDLLDNRFDCKDIEWLIPNGPPLDYLGMLLRQDSEYVHLSMETYILNTLELLGISDIKVVRTPIVQPIDPESTPLTSAETRVFMTGTGCLGWLCNTARPDVSYAHSRISQHMAKPNASALKALKHTFAYLKGTAHYSLSSRTHAPDRNVESNAVFMTDSSANAAAGWEFYVDSDFAGNAEVQNKRRSQNGYIALLNGTPVLWGSKVSSVAFAHPAINEAHADSSSGAAEVYSAANATYEFLHLSYIAEEMGLDFPLPFTLQMDNAAAQIFAEGSAYKTRLKHIDCRQEWVKTLRDRSIMIPQHVDTKNNLADLFTKILTAPDFERLRDRIMYNPNK